MENSIVPKSDQVNADWFISGPQTYEIERVAGNEANKDQPVNVFLKGVKVPYRPSKSMRRVMVAIFGADANTYAGNKITLYTDPEVSFGGMKVGGIKISHATGITQRTSILLTSSRSKRAPHVVMPLVEAQKSEPSPITTTAPVDTQSAQSSAREAASQGRNAFNKWWKDNPDLREEVRSIIEELKQTVEERESLNHAE